MSTIIIKESQLIKLMETAMDLDIYVQPKNFSASNGNEDLEGTIEDSIQKLQELQSMFKSGRKVSTESEGDFFKILDELNKVYDKVKYQNQFTSL